MRRRKPALPRRLAVPAAWQNELRRGSRINVARWGLHALSLLLLFGVPYARGCWRARAIQSHYQRAAACIFGAAQRNARGHALAADPSGLYAAMYLRSQTGWPSRCEPPLRELATGPAFILWPSVKAAEADVHKAAQIMLTELRALPETRSPGAPLPLRPLWGMQLLRRAVTADAHAAGVTDHTGKPAATGVPRQAAPTPTLLNVDAAPDATVKMWGETHELQVAVFDTRGVSYMRLAPDATTRARLPRPGGLRSVVRQPDGACLVWATTPERCNADHCAGRSVGLARMPIPLTSIPEPRWVAAHPFGAPARSIAWRGSRMWMAAANIDGTARLVEFTYDGGPAQATHQPPVEAVPKLLANARDMVVFTDGAGELNALALQVASERQWQLVQVRDGAKPRLLATLARSSGRGWLRTCSPASEASSAGVDARYFVLGDEAHALVGYVHGNMVTTWPVLHTELPAPPRVDRDPRVSLACTRDGAIAMAVVTDDDALKSVSCMPHQTLCVSQTLSERAASVALTYTSDGALVAYSGAPIEPQVRIQRLDMHGVAHPDSVVPGPCWERWGGMCGTPTFAWVGNRLVLAARSGAQLMALESHDAGQTWSALSATNLVQPPGPHVLPRVGLH